MALYKWPQVIYWPALSFSIFKLGLWALYAGSLCEYGSYSLLDGIHEAMLVRHSAQSFNSAHH